MRSSKRPNWLQQMTPSMSRNMTRTMLNKAQDAHGSRPCPFRQPLEPYSSPTFAGLAQALLWTCVQDGCLLASGRSEIACPRAARRWIAISHPVRTAPSDCSREPCCPTPAQLLAHPLCARCSTHRSKIQAASRLSTSSSTSDNGTHSLARFQFILKPTRPGEGSTSRQ